MPDVLRSCLAASIVLLAGCLADPSAAPATVQESNAGLDSTSPPVVAAHCRGYMWFTYLPVTALASSLPEGYEPSELGVVTTLSARVLHCHSVRGESDGNQSFDLALIVVPLAAAGGNEGPAPYNEYAFEVFLAEQEAPTLAALLRDYGFPVQDAKVLLNGTTASIRSATVDYRFEGKAADLPIAGGDPRRIHYVSGGQASFFDEETPQITGPGGLGAFTGTGGIWGGSFPIGTVATHLNPDALRGNVTFGRPVVS